MIPENVEVAIRRMRTLADSALGSLYEVECQREMRNACILLEAAYKEPAPSIAKIEAEARRYADMYPQSSDGRNTFVIFADWVAALAAQPPAAPVETGRDQIEVRDGLTDGYCDIINQTKKTTIGRVNLWNGTAQDLRDILASATRTPAEGTDLTNHHNALKCPYCNPNGLAFARPAPNDKDTRPDARLIYDLGETYRVTGDKVFHQAAERLQQLVSQVDEIQALKHDIERLTETNSQLLAQVETARKQALADAMKLIDDMRVRAAADFKYPRFQGQRGQDTCDALHDAYQEIRRLSDTSTVRADSLPSELYCTTCEIVHPLGEHRR